MIDFLAIGNFDIHSRQLIAYGAAVVLVLLTLFFIVVLALKIKAARDEKKSEVLPSLAELGYEDEEGETLPDAFDEESEDAGISAFYEDGDEEEQAIEHFLDR